MSLVLLNLEAGIATVTLNDPERLNAMSEAMAVDFRAVIKEVSESKARAVMIVGRGRSFSAGGDLEMLLAKRQLTWAENRARMMDFYRSFLCILELPVPVVAALHGHAVGAGFCLAAACDFRIGDRSCRLAAPFTRLGLHPGMGATLLLPRVLGPARAADWMLRGSRFKAEQAYEAGFLNVLVDEGQAEAEARGYLQEILRGGPLAVAALLRTLRPDPEHLHAALTREAEAQADSYAGDEFVEGVESVRDKREPSWVKG